MATTAIERVVKHAKKIADGKHPTVRPGLPHRLSDAAVAGDIGWQGDLKLTVIDKIPDGFELVKKPTDIDRQLVPGNTQGARHCLDSLAGVKLYRPTIWPDSGLVGPCFVLTEERTIEHPTHGHVTIPAGFTIQCGYQREWDAEQKRERRNAD